MAVSDCMCRNATIVEGIFGEIDPGIGSAKIQTDKLKYGEENFMESDSLTSGSSNGKLFEESLPVIIKSYTMTNTNRMEVVIITFGATIVSLKCPDKFGTPADIVLGFNDLDSYLNPALNPFIGCVLGRCANRIKNGSFSIKDMDYQLSKNDNGKDHLHGGVNGFGRQIWDSHIDGCSVVMSYLSEAGDEGYPGAVLTTVRFKLTADNKLEITMRATTSKPTIVNLSHGSLFNLAGHGAGEKELKNHIVSLNCDRWTFADYTDPVPTGAIRGVGGTVMDLRIPGLLGERMSKVPPGEGFDHNFCVTRSWQPGLSFVARMLHPRSGRILEVYSDQPGVQFYTGGRLLQPETNLPGLDKRCAEYLKEQSEMEYISYYEYGEEEEETEKSEPRSLKSTKPVEFIPGKNGACYKKNHAFSIQPQAYPNAVNFSHFPCTILRPGQIYYHDLTYKFGVQLGNYM
ncbi:aldose 1-epimerase [Cephus cinctus]|uniref:Galactose mutarotase n=1 Tax=Cephus cinctus TaxID=211228 RepID=A0AAJ7VXM9_CEPCN|nr:aldose 1-epimerase [Cephus cinctus]